MEHAITINRISSHKQEEGYSLSEQSKMNNDAALKDNRRVLKNFNIVESAKKSEKRDEFKEVVEFLKRNKSITHCYVEKPDRIARNFKDIVLVYDLIEDYDITFIFSKDSIVLSKDSHSGETINFDIKAVLAKNYIDNLSDEVKKGQRGMLSEGRWPGGSTPTGYKKVNKILVPNPPQCSFVKKAFESYASGSHSLKSLKKELDNQGFRSMNGKPLTKSNYHHILTNPIYYGTIRWNNKLYEGSFEPIIDKMLFDKVQAMLSRTRNGKVVPVYANHNFIYRGNLECGECGCKITAERKTKKNKGNGKVHEWTYYHCTHYRPCSQSGGVRENEIEKQIITILNSISLGPNTTNWLKERLKESHKDEVSFRESNLRLLTSNLTRTRSMLDKVYEDKIDGVIDDEMYHRKREQLMKNRDQLKEQITRHEMADQSYIDFGYLVMDVSNRAGKIFKVRKPEEKRYLLNFVFSNLYLRDKKVEFSLNKIFKVIADYQVSQNVLGN